MSVCLLCLFKENHKKWRYFMELIVNWWKPFGNYVSLCTLISKAFHRFWFTKPQGTRPAYVSALYLRADTLTIPLSRLPTCLNACTVCRVEQKQLNNTELRVPLKYASKTITNIRRFNGVGVNWQFRALLNFIKNFKFLWHLIYLYVCCYCGSYY